MPAKMTLRPESIEPLSFHFAIVGLAILVGYLVLQLLIWLESITFDAGFMTYIPLFPLAMIGGIIVQVFFNKLDQAEVIDRKMMNRIQGFALDILIVTAIATVSIDVIGEYLIPFLLLAIVGIAWNILGFMFLAPRIIPSYWFERGIGDLGQQWVLLPPACCLCVWPILITNHLHLKHLGINSSFMNRF